MRGKFNSVNDEAIYSQILEGDGETIGDVNTFGAVFTRLTIPESFDYEIPFTSITRVPAGVYIVVESSDGSVLVHGYAPDSAEDMRDLEERWSALKEEMAAFEEEDPEQ